MLENKSAQIEIHNRYNKCPLYLYNHEGSNSLVSIVFEVLSRKERWDDADYLSRMIFCAMVPESEWHESTNYGIGTSLYMDLQLFISINVPLQKITIQLTEDLHNPIVYTFEEFVTQFYNSASL